MRRSLLLVVLVACLSTPMEAQSGTDLIPLVQTNVFEVVVRRPPDPLTYAEPLPLDLMSYEEKANQDYLSVGTAFALPGGRFVTAAHVLGLERPSLQNEFGLRTADGQFHALGNVTAFSTWRDYAVFEVPGLVVPGLVTADAPVLNSRVYTAGNALGSGVAVREGLFTSKTPESWKGTWSFLRFSAPASPGNSGGPLLDERGRVLGIVARKSENENLNYALPWSEVDLSPVAHLDEQYLYGFALAPDRIAVENHRTWPLPLSTEGLRSILVDLARDGQGNASLRLRESLSPGPEVWNDSRYASMPGFLEKKDTGSWEINLPTDTKSYKIGSNGVLRAADRYDGVSLSLKAPSNASVGKLARDPQALFDLLLSGYPISRTVGGKSIRILSFGPAASTKTFEDSRGRVWTLSRFDDANVDFSELLLWLPTPSGGVGLLRGLPRPSALGYEIDFQAMADFAFVTYEGTLAQWGSFVGEGDLLPRLFRPWSLYWKPNQNFTLETPEFRWTFGKETARIQDQALLAVETGYFGAKAQPLWGVGSVLYSGEGDYRDFLAFNRSAAPRDQDDQAVKDDWKTLLNREGSFTGVPYDTKDRSVARSLVFPATADAAVPFAYWVSINADGMKDHTALRTRLKGMEASVVYAAASVPPADLPKVNGATIFDAIRQNDRGLVKKFLQDKKGLAVVDRDGLTPLQAALSQRASVAADLLDAGASLAHAPGTPEPAELAIRSGSEDLARRLLAAGAPRTPAILLASIDLGWTDLALDLAKDATLRDAPGADGTTALMRALDKKQVALAQGLLEAGSSVSARDQQGWNSLDHALRSGNADLARQVLKRSGSNQGKPTLQGWTPLHFAAAWLPELLPDLLAVDKTALDAQTVDGSTALMLALRAGNGWSTLLEAGAKTGSATSTGWTPLAVALRSGHEAEVKALLAAPLDHRATAEGWNLLHLAARYQPSALPWLTTGWSDGDIAALVSARTPSGQTPLHLAVSSHNSQAVRWLVQHGADPTIKDDRGRTPADQARAQGETWVADVLP